MIKLPTYREMLDKQVINIYKEGYRLIRKIEKDLNKLMWLYTEASKDE